MTSNSDHTFLSLELTNAEQIKKLESAIQERIMKLEQVRHKKRQVETELSQSRVEMERRVELIMGKSEEIDALMELGQILQKESCLMEQLKETGEARDHLILKEKKEIAMNKATSLVAEIQEVKQHLSEIRARFSAASQVLDSAHSFKPKRSKRKL